MLASELKALIRNRQLTIGPMLTCDFWPGYLEIFKYEGMHYAVLDLEHGSATLPMVEELCRTARLLDFPLIVRPETSTYHVLRKYLDMGPSGFMIPWTERPEQIDTLRDAVFLPPKGRRGPGGPSILANRSLDRAGWDEVESSLLLILQIETPAGVRDVASLANQEWIDATMLGPYDLSLNLGRWAELSHPDVISAIDEVHARSLQAGKPCGMVVNSLEQARFWIERGMHFLIASEVSHMVRLQSRALARGIGELFGAARSAGEIEVK